jgi:hypothetical protein
VKPYRKILLKEEILFFSRRHHFFFVRNLQFTMAAPIVVQEAIKEAVFVQYIQRNAPAAGAVFGSLSELTTSLKHQREKAIADRSEGDNRQNFMEMYAQVKLIAPGLAGAAFAKSAIIVEYLLKEVPESINAILNIGGNVLENIRSRSPDAVSVAEVLGDKIASFVATQGPVIIEGLETAGTSAISYFQQHAPNELQDAAAHAGITAEELSAIIAKEMPVAVGALGQVGNEALGGLPTFALMIKSKVGAISQNLPGATKLVGDHIASAAGAISSVVTVDTVAQVTSIALGVLGTAAAAFPFLLPLQIAMKDIGNAVQRATYNRETADILGKRCADCTVLAVEMAPKLEKITKNADEREESLKPLIEALDECTDFLNKFTKKGFISVMITWKNDDRSLMNLDKKVTNAIQNLSLRINGYQIDQQFEDSDKLDKIFKLMEKIPVEGLSQPTTIDPKILAEVARQAGCATATEISSELQEVGFELEKIQSAVAEIAGKLDKIDHKLDDMTNLLSQTLESQRKQDAELKNMVMQSQAEIRRENQKTLQIMMQMKSGGAAITKVFSTNQQAKQLARRATEIGASPGVGLIIIHSHGVGLNTLVNVNGAHGINGRMGTGKVNGSNGGNGSANHIDGQDGK